MKRNAFTSDRHGVITNYEPGFSGDKETETFHHWQKHDTSQQGGTICLSPYITLDALLSLQQIIAGEMMARAESQLENAT